MHKNCTDCTVNNNNKNENGKYTNKNYNSISVISELLFLSQFFSMKISK